MKSFFEEFKNSTKKELNEAFIASCEKGDLDRVRYILNSPELRVNAHILYNNNQGFRIAFEKNQMNVVKYLTSSKELKTHSNFEFYHTILLEKACDSNDLDWFKYLVSLTTSSSELSIALNTACYKGKVPMVDYLLTSTEFKGKIIVNNTVFNEACKKGEVDVFKYLLSSEWKDNIKIHADNDLSFEICCDEEELKAVQFFIFELNIPKTAYIAEYLQDEPTPFKNMVANLFHKRDLNIQLEKELPSDKINNISKKYKL
jgi:hypothetical protein